jgi:hypothetical protein
VPLRRLGQGPNDFFTLSDEMKAVDHGRPR